MREKETLFDLAVKGMQGTAGMVISIERFQELEAKAALLDWIGENGAAFFLLSDCGGFCTWEEICAEITRRIEAK